MPTEWEKGFAAGYNVAQRYFLEEQDFSSAFMQVDARPDLGGRAKKRKKPLSKWQKFVKANSKKSKYIYKSGAKKGKLNLKKMGVDYRKKKR